MIRADRLEVLANYLETHVQDSEFDIAQYFNDCGTPACAIGHACTMPYFQDLGLAREHNWPYLHVPGKRYAVECGSEIGMHLFGITEEQSDFLFYKNHEHPQTRLEVIANLRKVAEGYEPPVPEPEL